MVPSIEHPLRYHHSNVDGTISVLEASRQAEVKRLVYMASSSCYGLPDEFPTQETAEIRAMRGRVLLRPYYYTGPDSVALAGIQVIICPPDKKVLHGMTDAILVPGAVTAV